MNDSIKGWFSFLDFSGFLTKKDFRESKKVDNAYHKLWLISKKCGNVRSFHCTCMASMSQSSNHGVTRIHKIEVAVRYGLNSPSCTTWICSAHKY